MKKQDWKILKKHGITPDNLSVGGSLDLEGTQITSLPDSLSVGGSLYLEGTQIANYPVVYNCGKSNRAIYLLPSDKSKVKIGCSIFSKKSAINAICDKYRGEEMNKYIEKVHILFKMKNEQTTN